MEKLRLELLELDKKRKTMEEEIEVIVNYLESGNNPGIKGSLIDDEGFPLPNIDHYKIREERGKLAKLQNDLSQLMKIIEEKMSYYFSQQKIQNNDNNNNNAKMGNNEPISIEIKDDSNINNNNIHTNKYINKEPFAIVTEVTPNSPAFESGLMTGDAITVFNNTVVKGSSMDPLQVVAKIAKENINKQIPIKVIRKDQNGCIQIVDLNLTPHTWAGRGILGCKLNLL